jgi:fucose permease
VVLFLLCHGESLSRRAGAQLNSQVGCAAIELVVSSACFWKSTAAEFRAANRQSVEENKKGGLRDALFKRPSARVTWLCALFLLGYVGVEVALGGWIVTFMIRVRQGGAFASGMTATGFWLGITVGRVILGFVTPRVGEKVAISVRSFRPSHEIWH